MTPLLSCEHLCMDCDCHWLGYDLSVSPARVPRNLQGLKPGSVVNLLLEQNDCRLLSFKFKQWLPRQPLHPRRNPNVNVRNTKSVHNADVSRDDDINVPNSNALIVMLFITEKIDSRDTLTGSTPPINTNAINVTNNSFLPNIWHSTSSLTSQSGVVFAIKQCLHVPLKAINVDQNGPSYQPMSSLKLTSKSHSISTNRSVGLSIHWTLWRL